MRPRLALVPGEPAGIGPELIVRAAQQDWEAQLVVHGDAATLHRAGDALGLPIALHRSGESPRSPRSLELVEIVHKAGMLLAARPTTSRDGVFESAGMFSLTAKKGAELLELIKPIHIEWPINTLHTRPAALQMVTLAAASTRPFSTQAEQDWTPFFNKPSPVLKLQGQRWLKFDIDRLGWFSAQQPLAREGLKSMLSVRYQDQGFEHKQAFLEFRNHQAVVKLFPYENKFCAFNIPRRAAACVVMLGVKNERYYLGHTCFDGHYASNLALKLDEVEAEMVPQLIYALVNLHK